MSTHVIAGTTREAGWADLVSTIDRQDLQAPLRFAIAERLRLLCIAHLREPSIRDDGTNWIATFTPDLTADEVTKLGLLMAVARSGMAQITPAEWDRIRPELQALRDFRQLGRNAFMALTAADRDRALYDAQTSTTIILLALLRD